MRGQLHKTEVLAPLSMWRLLIPARDCPTWRLLNVGYKAPGGPLLCSVRSLFPLVIASLVSLVNLVSHVRARTESSAQGSRVVCQSFFSSRVG